MNKINQPMTPEQILASAGFSTEKPITNNLLSEIFWDIRQDYGSVPAENFVGFVAGLPENIKPSRFAESFVVSGRKRWQTSTLKPSSLFSKATRMVQAELGKPGEIAQFIAEHNEERSSTALRTKLVRRLHLVR